MPFEVGQFAGDYEVLSILGKGGMGRVYRVRNVISNRTEAMKVLLADVAAEAELGDRFLGEIRTLARLDHPNIAKFHTAFKVENQLVMVMEYVEGVTLSERAKQNAPPLDDMLSYVGQTLDALSFAHKNGVIHRDIKPSNIMITPHGVVKLMDFGIAKSSTDPLLTRPGTTLGSMLYMSPEQVRGTTVDARSDLYSVGVLLYELTAGRRPFEAENTFAILDAQLNAAPKPPIELNPSLPRALNDIILTALDKEPMRRFQTGEAFKNALESLRQRPPTALPKSTPQIATGTGGVKKGNRGLWMALGAAACVCVLAGGAILLPRFFRSEAATQKVVPVVQQTTPAPVPPVTTTAEPALVPQTATPPVETSKTPTQTATPVHNKASNAVPQRVDATPQYAQPQLPPQPVPEPVKPTVSSGPSQQEMDAAEEAITKLHARSESVHGSLDTLKSQQAAQGLNLRPDISSAASRMDSYLGAADRARQAGNLDSARKNMDRAEEEINKLEAFFGR